MDNTGIATAIIDASPALMRTAITTANNNISGARMSRRRDIMITSCIIFTSLVILVTNEAELNLSKLEKENSWILLNNPFLNSAEKPTEAWEEQ